jgi:hypothetical protein
MDCAEAVPRPVPDSATAPLASKARPLALLSRPNEPLEMPNEASELPAVRLAPVPSRLRLPLTSDTDTFAPIENPPNAPLTEPVPVKMTLVPAWPVPVKLDAPTWKVWLPRLSTDALAAPPTVPTSRSTVSCRLLPDTLSTPPADSEALPTTACDITQP